jgi:hypothetical protein
LPDQPQGFEKSLIFKGAKVLQFGSVCKSNALFIYEEGKGLEAKGKRPGIADTL